MRLPRVRLGTALLLCAIVAAWSYVWVSSRRTSPISWWHVGCYKGPQGFKDVEFHITRQGALTFPGATVPVRISNDKVGYSFLPERRIVLDIRKHALAVARGYPDLLRINSDGSVYVPDTGTEDVLFSSCART
jgi:hypothetical protein